MFKMVRIGKCFSFRSVQAGTNVLNEVGLALEHKICLLNLIRKDLDGFGHKLEEP